MENQQTTPAILRLAAGPGWAVSDYVCQAGPADRPFEEQHARTSIAIVLGGTFHYRTTTGQQLMTPGSVLLGNPGDCFCCSHHHGTGDRCFGVSYTPEFFESVLRGVYRSSGVAASGRFAIPRIPPLRDLARVAAKAELLLTPGETEIAYEELAIELAAAAWQLQQGRARPQASPPPSAVARVTRIVRFVDHEPQHSHSVASLAHLSKVSLYHFLRSFEQVTGVTPHQYLLRQRLRKAATRLLSDHTAILTIALDNGFADASHFSRAFRAEFGVSPSAYRAHKRPSKSDSRPF